jgi:parallel beta-helix repeat protein
VKKLGFLTAMLLLLGMLAFVRPSYSSGTTFSLAPSRVEVLPGQNFTIDVIVSNVSDLFTWQLAVKYDARIINCTAAWVPEDNVFAGRPSMSVPPVLNDPTDDGYNYTIFGNTLMSGSVAVEQGFLCELNFTALACGQTQIVLGTVVDPVLLLKANPYDPIPPMKVYSFLWDSSLNEMPFVRENSETLNGPQALLTILSSTEGTTDPTPGNYTYVCGTNVSVTAFPNSSCAFDHWLLNSTIRSTNPLNVMMNGSYTLQPFFSRLNCTLTMAELMNGTTNLAVGQHTYHAGDTVQVVATATIGYRFDRWILDGSNEGSDNPLNLVMNSNHTLSAVFSAVSHVGTVYIRADGSIDPPDEAVSTLDNETYLLTENTNSMIVIQRNNIVLDGSRHTLQGSGSGEGVSLFLVSNVTVRNMNIQGFGCGMYLFGAFQNVVSGNNITGNIWLGLRLYYSSNNSICSNNILANKDDGIRFEYSSDYNSIVGNNIVGSNWLGIYIDSSSSNTLYHNNFADNANQVHVDAHDYPPHNTWDNGMEGNFWKDYNGVDSNYDGIGDVSYNIDSSNTDHYPLIGAFSSFETSLTYPLEIFSNSSIKNFNYSVPDRRIGFDVEGQSGTVGFCKMTLPHDLVNPAYLQVLIDNGNTAVQHPNYNLHDNLTHRWIYFAYNHSTHTVVIQEDTTPPTILILSPENKTYETQVIPLTFTVNETISWGGYSLDSSTNITITGNTTLPSLPDGKHNIVVFANDIVGNMGKSNIVMFAVDTTPPWVSVVSPENKTYATRNVTLTFMINGSASWSGYSLDGGANVTVAQNTTLTALADGSHHLIAYASDAIGNTGKSDTIFFTVDSTPPNIVSTVQFPFVDGVLPGNSVTVNVAVIDNVTAVQSVNLTYAYITSAGAGNGSITMTEVSANVWTATLTALPYETNVTYVIIASDYAGNTITTKQLGYEYRYTVIPEYQFQSILYLFIVGLLAALLMPKKWRTIAIQLGL